ncbi:putative bifunctional diguanylate cyclase/phosphodiesterase [Paraburkholderia caledonica]|uniref:putative bifunctional diguanylate cyclase/phosphodiesterase n=1 Tax=Paraburkholderia caledonica TaxID=134536 RepID=UPI000B401EBE
MTQQVSVLPASRSHAKSRSASRSAPSHHAHNSGMIAQSPDSRNVARASSFDLLTGVYDRACATRRAGHLLSAAKAGDVAMLVVNLDGFSRINDIAGYDLGDRLLRRVAQRLASSISEDELLARIGGDEFVIVMHRFGDVSRLTRFARQVLASFGEPFVIAGREYRVSASVGVAVSGDDARNAASLMRDAGAAMRHAKRCGRGTVCFFTGEMREGVQRRFAIEGLLHHALARGEFRLAYQAVVDATSRKTIGVEALARWTSNELGDVPPAEFIPVAEQAGLMESIGDWVLEMACAQAADWRWSIAPDIAVSVNISPSQFSERLVRHVAACLDNSGLEPSALQLEITEGMQLPDDAAVRATTAALAKLGVKLVIDDFGTGYASMSYLKRFPVDSLKIDRSIVAGLPRDADSVAITHALVTMAHACNMRVTAEGVETEAQAVTLREIGCDALQGYLFSRPCNAAECAAALSRRPVRMKNCHVHK